MFFLRYPRAVLISIAILCATSAYLATQRISFSFDLEDFYPTEDPDLTFFKEFKERFEPDDNFMMVGLSRAQGVFDSAFLQKALAFSLDFRRLSFPVTKILDKDTLDNNIYTYEKAASAGDSVLTMHPVTSVQSILNFEYPIKTPLFGFTTSPAVHLEQPDMYEQDSLRIMSDERMRGFLVSKDGKTMVLYAKTHRRTSQQVAKNLVYGIHALLDKHQITDYYLLGPANLQTRIPETQVREFIFSTAVSSVLLLIVMFLIFRRFWGVMVSVGSITVGMVLFIGFLAAVGKPMDAMSMLYPIIMIIVGTSDVIHVMSKYVDELQKGHNQREAIHITLKEIGMSVFLTSFTTAIGFFSLYTSKVAPIRSFGINAGVGVLIAYASVIVFTTTVLTFFSKEQIIRLRPEGSKWTGWMDKLYHFISTKSKVVWAATAVIIGICALGTSQVNTNNRIEDLLPVGEKVTTDFKFFEEQFSGFRPMDIAISARDTHNINDYEMMREIAKMEDYLRSLPEITSTLSATALYKSINRAVNGDRVEAYAFPDSREKFEEYKRISKKVAKNANTLLVSRDGKHARIAARFLDIGAERSRALSAQIKDWISKNMNLQLADYKQTGTGVLVDKNAEYMRDSLMWGLGFAILVIAVIMGLLYRDIKMVLIALVPNVLPLFVAAAILGFTGIALDASVAIVFSIIFGIAVDDTIHILGRFRLLRMQNIGVDEALRTTLLETGKAVCLTSVILFMGFLILVFSSSPPVVTVGLLISFTLISALVFDIFLLPVLLRAWLR